MDEMNLDWDDLRLFLAVARGGGLAAASAETGKSPPTLGRRMLTLEKKLGQELFLRLPRGYDLTGQGRALLDRLGEVEDRISPLAQLAGKPHRTPVKISAGTWMTRVLCRNIADISEDGVTLRFIAADHVLNITRREAVIGIRNHRPEQTGLACRRVGSVSFATYATDESVTSWARVMSRTPSALWLAQTIGDDASIEVTNARNALDLALAGGSRVVLPTLIGDLHHPVLKRVSPEIEALRHDQWIVSHEEERFSPPVRRTIDRIYAVLSRVLK